MGEIWDYINRTIVATEYQGNRTMSAGALETMGAGVLGELFTGMTAGGVAAAMSASNKDCNIWTLLYSNNDLKHVAIESTDRTNDLYSSYPDISTYMAENNLEFADDKCTKIRPATTPKIEEGEFAEADIPDETAEDEPSLESPVEFPPMPSFEELFPVSPEEEERKVKEAAVNADPKSSDINAGDDTTIISDGTYLFGQNIPDGTYDLFLIKGSGHVYFLDKKMKSDFDNSALLSFSEGCSSTYRGLSSARWVGFEISGGIKVRITRAQSIVI